MAIGLSHFFFCKRHQYDEDYEDFRRKIHQEEKDQEFCIPLSLNPDLHMESLQTRWSIISQPFIVDDVGIRKDKDPGIYHTYKSYGVRKGDVIELKYGNEHLGIMAAIHPRIGEKAALAMTSQTISPFASILLGDRNDIRRMQRKSVMIHLNRQALKDDFTNLQAEVSKVFLHGDHLIQKAYGLFAGVCADEGICRLGFDEFLAVVTTHLQR